VGAYGGLKTRKKPIRTGGGLAGNNYGKLWLGVAYDVVSEKIENNRPAPRSTRKVENGEKHRKPIRLEKSLVTNGKDELLIPPI